MHLAKLLNTSSEYQWHTTIDEMEWPRQSPDLELSENLFKIDVSDVLHPDKLSLTCLGKKN